MLPLSKLGFLITEHSVLLILVFYEKCMLRENANNSAIRWGFFVTERMQLNPVYVW